MNVVPDPVSLTPHEQDQRRAKLAELARLSPLDYDACRTAEAEAMGVRVGTLDQEVERARPRKPGEDDAPDPFEEVEPWPDRVNGASLLDELRAAVLRFCVLPPHSAEAIAAWVLHAWAHDAADISPVLAFTSPEKRCGKTTALSVVGALAPRAMHSANISTAVLFRVVEKHGPTVLIDEADTFLSENDGLRGILNGGHNRLSAYVWRCDGEDREPRRFAVWAPKCIAMIGRLPDTLEDRALVVSLRRRRPSEHVERFRADRLAEFEPLRRRARRWVSDSLLRLREADPEVPTALHDRAQDNARPLCAVADAAGGHWPALIREALVTLAAGAAADVPASAGVLLLGDMAEVMAQPGREQMRSSELCAALGALEDAPWAEWRGGKPITTRGVAKLLKPFGIAPEQDRHGSYYRRSAFADAVSRYAPNAPRETATSATSATLGPSATRKSSSIHTLRQNGTCGGCERVADGICHGEDLDSEGGDFR